MRAAAASTYAAVIVSAALLLTGTTATYASVQPDPEASTSSRPQESSVTAEDASDPAAQEKSALSPLSPQLQLLLDSRAQPGTVEAARAVGVATEGAGSLQTDAQERLSVTVTFASAPSDAQLESVRALGAEIVAVSPFLPKATIFVPTSSIEALAQRDGVVGVVGDLRGRTGASSSRRDSPSATVTPAVAPAVAPTGCRSIPVDVDPGLKSDAARARFGVDGTGVTVGIISDTFDQAPSPASTAAQDVQLGVLPGPGNPCGYTQPVEVVTAQPQADATDEGRGMAQMVHGVAPGAKLLFGAGLQSPTAFSEAIRKLTDRGADIIVDDVMFPANEPMYQEGEIALAMKYASDHGVLLISAAQNMSQFGWPGTKYADHAIGAFESTMYVPMPCPQLVQNQYAPVPVDCHNFGTDDAPDSSNDFAGQNNARGAFAVVVHWAEPVNGVTGELSPAVFAHAGGIDSIDDPTAVEAVGEMSDPAIPASSFSGSLSAPGNYQLYVVRKLGPGHAVVTPRFKLAFVEDEPLTVIGLQYFQNTDTVTVGPNILGHTTYANVLSVGAAPWQQPTVNESFSSMGPSTYLYGPVKRDNSPSDTLPSPDVRQKPDLTSLDSAQTSFFSPPAVDGKYYFAGTSAASPAAAGVAALALQYSPSSTAQDIKSAMMSTTSTIDNPYVNMTSRQVSGTGLLNAEATLAALPADLDPQNPTNRNVLAASGQETSTLAGLVGGAVLALALGVAIPLLRRRTRGA